MLKQPSTPSLSISGVDDGGDVLQRHPDVPQRSQSACSRELAQPIPAKAGAIVNLGRFEQANLVVMPQRLDRQPSQLRKSADSYPFIRLHTRTVALSPARESRRETTASRPHFSTPDGQPCAHERNSAR